MAQIFVSAWLTFSLALVAQIFASAWLKYSLTFTHKLGNGFLEQALDVLHAAYVRYLQQFSDFFPTRVFFGGAILSSHYKNLQCGASILHHIGGLHKVWDGLGIGGSFLKAYSELGGTKTYYKLSNFDKS